MIPSGDEGARGRRKKGLSFLGSTSSMKGPAQREPSRTSAPSAKNICPITTR